MADEKYQKQHQEPHQRLGSISGYMIDPRGRLLIGADIRIIATNDAGDGRSGSYAQPTGAYKIESMEPGKWNICIHFQGEKIVEENVTVPTQGASDLFRDFTVHSPYRIRIQLEDEYGLNLEHYLWAPGNERQLALARESLTCVATREAPGFLMPALRRSRRLVDGDGMFVGWASNFSWPDSEDRSRYFGIIELAEPGKMCVSVVLRDAVMATCMARDGETVHIQLCQSLLLESLSTLQIRMSGSEGVGILRGAYVRVAPAFGKTSVLYPDKEGVVFVRDHVPGILEMRLGAAGREEIRDEVYLQPGNSEQVVQYRLDEAQQLEGIVLDVNGNVLSEPPFVEAICAEGYAIDRLGGEPVQAEMARGGRFVFDKLGKRRYYIRTRDVHGLFGVAIREVTPGTQWDGRLTMSPGSEARIWLRPMFPDSAWIRITDASGLPIAEIANDDAYYEYDVGIRSIYLLAGRYKAYLMVGSSVSEVQSFEVAEGAPTACVRF